MKNIKISFELPVKSLFEADQTQLEKLEEVLQKLDI